VKPMSMITTAGVALIWTASLATPSLAQTAGTAGQAGSQAGSGERPGAQAGAPQEGGTHDPAGQGGVGTGAERTRIDEQDTTATGTTGERGAPRGSDRRANDMQQFLERAAIVNMAEVQLGQLGVDRAQDPQVKQFAEMMVEEHGAALEQLRSLAATHGVQLPDELDAKHRRMHLRLSEAQEDRFDREFMNAMVATHKDAEKLFRKRAGKQAQQQARSGEAGRSGEGDDAGAATGATGTTAQAEPTSGEAGAVGTSGAQTAASVEAFAAMTLPKVQNHLEQARSLEQQVKRGNRQGGNGEPQQ
jgi:putative membrane protein